MLNGQILKDLILHHDNLICSCGTIIRQKQAEEGLVYYCPKCFYGKLPSQKDSSIKIEITEEQKQYASQIGEKIRENKQDENNDFTPTYFNKQGNEVNYLGVLGEVIICDLFNTQRPSLKKDSVDDGYDLILQDQKIDVKSTDYRPRQDASLIVYPKDISKKETDGYILVRILEEADIAEILMFISQKDFISHSDKVDLGYGERLVLKTKNCPQDYTTFEKKNIVWTS